MSDFRFGVYDYGLNYHPRDVSDGCGGIDWDKVECVEIDCVRFVRKRTCLNTSHRLDESRFLCSECWFGCWVKDVSDGCDKLPNYCPRCGAKVVGR